MEFYEQTAIGRRRVRPPGAKSERSRLTWIKLDGTRQNAGKRLALVATMLASPRELSSVLEGWKALWLQRLVEGGEEEGVTGLCSAEVEFMERRATLWRVFLVAPVRWDQFPSRKSGYTGRLPYASSWPAP